MKKWKIRVPDRVALEVEQVAEIRGIPVNQFVLELLVAAVKMPERDEATERRVREEIEEVLREIEQ